MCYHAKLGHSTSKGLNIIRGEIGKCWGSSKGMECAEYFKKHAIRMCYLA